MPISLNELDQFHRFARAEIENTGTATLRELIARWESTRDQKATVESIRESLAEYDAGLDEPIETVMTQLRDRLGLTE